MTILLTICNDTPPLKTRHICYTVEKDETNREYCLIQVVEESYQHPDVSPDVAGVLVPVIQTHIIKRLKESDQPFVAPLILMHNMQNNIKLTERK